METREITQPQHEKRRTRPPGAAPLWQPGQSGNPAGRPKGSRSKLTEDFLRELAADFASHGAQVIAETRENDPSTYLKIIAALVPREDKLEIEGRFAHAFVVAPAKATREEWDETCREMLAKQSKVIDYRTKPETAGNGS